MKRYEIIAKKKHGDPVHVTAIYPDGKEPKKGMEIYIKSIGSIADITHLALADSQRPSFGDIIID